MCLVLIVFVFLWDLTPWWLLFNDLMNKACLDKQMDSFKSSIDWAYGLMPLSLKAAPYPQLFYWILYDLYQPRFAKTFNDKNLG
mgnify:CR=1 FL=1